MNFNFGEVLTRAWQIVWKFKILWIFGILAGCARGGGGGNAGGGNNRFDFSSPNVPPGMERFFQNMADHAVQYALLAIALLCVIWIVAIFLGTIGRIGLIRGVAQADGGAERLILGQLFSESMPYFWRMFGLSLIIALPVLILVAFLLAGMFAFLVPVAVSNGGGGEAPRLGFLAIISIIAGCLCLLVPFLLVAGLIIRQAENAVVLEGMRVFPALSRGWEVFRKNLGPIFLMAIILWVIGIVAGLIIALPIIAVAIPTALAFALGEGRRWTPLLLLGVCFCIYIPVSMVLNGVLTSYIQSAWTLTYRRLTGSNPPVPAPVVEPPTPPEDNDRTVIARPNA